MAPDLALGGVQTRARTQRPIEAGEGEPVPGTSQPVLEL